MAANHHQPSVDPPSAEMSSRPSVADVRERLEEEINRARRHETQLSCLLVKIDELEDVAGEQRSELPAQTLAYVGGALSREIRSFDRVGRLSESELLISLPGADGTRAEIVGRRLLDRLRAIKVESDGSRRPLDVSVGLAAWHGRLSGEELLARSRAALHRAQANGAPSPGSPASVPSGPTPPTGPDTGLT
jgi:diguanylate cyclase (GGDEF)-like protein